MNCKILNLIKPCLAYEIQAGTMALNCHYIQSIVGGKATSPYIHAKQHKINSQKSFAVDYHRKAFFNPPSRPAFEVHYTQPFFDKILTSEYDLWKSQINEKDAKKVSFDQYRKAVSYVGDYDYKSIRDKQIGRELVFKIGVYTVAAIVAVPCVLTGNAPGERSCMQ